MRTLPELAEIEHMTPAERHLVAEEIKHDEALHTGDFWTCRACMYISILEGRTES